MTEGEINPRFAEEKKRALVICIVPAYNAKGTIIRSIRSALRQRGPAVKVVVVDHGSQDGTPDEVTREFGSDDRLLVIRLDRSPDEVSSASRPLNAGIKRGLELDHREDSTWLLRLDADDFLANDFVLHEALSEGREQLIMGMMLFFNGQEKKSLLYGPDDKHRTRGSLISGGVYAAAHHSTLMRADLLKGIHGGNQKLYCEDIGYGEDLDFTARLLQAVNNSEFRFLAKPLVCKFIGEGTISTTKESLRIWKDLAIVFNRHPELPKYLLRRLAIDLVLRKGGKRLDGIRRKWGFPAGQVGIEMPVSYEPVGERIYQLDERL